MAIPKGTLLAIFITSSVYLGMAWVVGMTVNREVAVAMGCNNMTTPELSDVNCTALLLLVNDETASCDQCTSCEQFALLHSFQVVEMISLVGPLITAGEGSNCVAMYCCYGGNVQGFFQPHFLQHW